MIIESERLLLRPIQIEHAVEVFEYRSDADTNRFQNFIPQTIQDVEAFIGNSSKAFNHPGSWFQLVIIEKHTNKVIGDLGLHFFGQENLQVELGCTLSKKYQGKGYASEAMKMTIGYLFGKYNKHRIIASVDPDNEKSIKLLERTGFKKEAHFRESLFFKGFWVDDIIYAILEKEWGSI